MTLFPCDCKEFALVRSQENDVQISVPYESLQINPPALFPVGQQWDFVLRASS